ncbi:hypothetical protein D6825_02565 [Candidatus Woesearchaeota archaeon]|nr:MAG: hypothetical protein D6825_02565 [Candidatus Woesearchaeota archaeon]
MSSLLTLIIILLLAAISFKFLVGVLRTVITSALTLLAIGVVISLLLGQDVISPAVGAIVSAIANNSSVP